MTTFLVALSIFCHVIAAAYMNGENKKLNQFQDMFLLSCFFGVVWSWVWLFAQLFNWLFW